MGEYRCEGIGSMEGGTYDTLSVKGIFTAHGAVNATLLTGEGVMNFADIKAETINLTGVTNIKGTFEVVNATVEGVVNAVTINALQSFHSDGVVNADCIRAATVTMIRSKDVPSHPIAKIRSFFSGRAVEEEKNAHVREIDAATVLIEDYSAELVSGQDVTIGRGCIIGKVQADKRLRIHTSAVVKDLDFSVTPEYFE